MLSKIRVMLLRACFPLIAPLCLHTKSEKQAERDNSDQGNLGIVVRWGDHVANATRA